MGPSGNQISPTFSRILSIYSSPCCACRRLSNPHWKAQKRWNHSNPWLNQTGYIERKVRLGSRDLEISTGRLARFADGCSIVKLGETSVMVTAVCKSKATPASFLPLTVDYRQKAAAAGRIPTNYMRRELGPSEKEILTSRMIDRSVRPLFPVGFNQETQLICNLLAVDGVNDPDVLGINAASAALAISDIPWKGPIGAVRVGFVDHEPVINPTRRDMKNSQLNLILAGASHNRIVMLDASAENIHEPEFKQCVKVGLQHTQLIIREIEELHRACGKQKKDVLETHSLPQEALEAIKDLTTTRIREVFTDSSHHKFSRDNAIGEIRDSVVSQLRESCPDMDSSRVVEGYYSHVKNIFRDLIFERNLRCDGRGLEDLRPISCEVNKFGPLHGSALFQRGQTQVLGTLTFDSPDSAAKVDSISAILSGIKEKNFFLHYEFPPYSTNETGRPGGVGRREIGHGALAEKGLRPVIPENYPFTIRLTAEVLESNGSSSLASICAGSLALLDAGVPIKSPVAGVAIGLVTKTNPDTGEIEDHRILTDLLGIEDYMGDMDFKLAGSRNGITALQADIKLPISMMLIDNAIRAGMKGKQDVLDIMNSTIALPRDNKDNRPVIDKLDVPVHKRGRFLGSGGHNLKKLAAETGVTVSQVEEGIFHVFAPNKQALEEAQEKIEALLTDEREPNLEFGAIYKATVVEIRDYGVMVQLYPTMSPALIHNSQLDQRKISHPSAINLEVGKEMSVKYFGRDPASGKMRLSRKVLYSPATAVIRNLGNNSS